MKKVVFGNPHTDWWSLSLNSVVPQEGVIAIDGELKAGFFVASTPMCVAPEVLERFAEQLRQLDRTLKGEAELKSANVQSEIAWRLSVNHLGHVTSAGRYTINGNALDFSFVTDQTQLSPLLKWIDGLLGRYRKKA